MRSRGWFLLPLVLLPCTGAGQGPGSATPFRQALPGYRFEFPRDHFSHPAFQTEWWYYTGNLRARDGRRFGFELTFFRQAVETPGPGDASRPASPWDVRDVFLAHFALSDIDGRNFHHAERTNRAGPGLAGADGAAGEIWNGNWSARIEGERHRVRAVASGFEIDLALDSLKPPVIHGVNGVSQKAEGAGQASHYVSLTRLAATGAITVDGRRAEVEGSAWMDHEFFTNSLGRDQRGWDWLGLQLDDGTELMLYRLRRADGTADRFSAGTLVEKNGRAVHLGVDDFTFAPLTETWTSATSRATYPVAWRVGVPGRGLDFEIGTPLASQELVGRRGFTPTYWEGAVRASGSRRGAPLGGVGYLEMTGYDKAVVLGPPPR
jgi:predicted secreted hydrolase